jgi:hypothetical protein
MLAACCAPAGAALALMDGSRLRLTELPAKTYHLRPSITFLIVFIDDPHYHSNISDQ